MIPYAEKKHQGIITDFALEVPRCVIAADMGLGKTAAEAAAVATVKLARSDGLPVLVAAPKRVARSVWSGELEKWDAFQGLSITKILGTEKQRLKALKRSATDMYTVNYENLPWLVETLGSKWPFKWVIADESTRLKGFRLHGGGARAKAIARVAHLPPRWNNLTGTLAPNGLVDLWGQYWFVDFGQRLCRTFTQFLDRWFFVNDYTHEIRPKPGAAEEMYAAIADVTLVLRAEDWLDIQKPQEITVEVELDTAARKLYDQMEKEFFVEIGDGDGIDALNAASKSSKLLQICSGSIYDEFGTAHPVHDAKVDALRSIVDETGEPLLVPYWFQFDVPRIMAAFPSARALRSQKDEDDWNAGKVELGLIHPASGGHGLNLQHGGRNVVFFSQTWDLELRQQVIERVGPARQAQAGFNRVVRIFDILVKDSMDEVARERVQSKCSVQDALRAARARRSV